MKRIFLIVIIVVLGIVLVACGQVGIKAVATPNPHEQEIAKLQAEVEALIEGQATPPPQDTPVATPTPTLSPTPAPTPQPIVIPDRNANPEMYSNTAHMVLLDVATGYAQFDHFEPVYGDEAVDALVKYEGYDEVDALVEVKNWPEGSFYEKNSNNELRTIDLTTVSIGVMIQADGILVESIPSPQEASYSAFLDIYNANHAYVLNYFFYRITINDAGTVTRVEQVYRP